MGAVLKRWRRANFFVGNGLFSCIDITAIIGLKTGIVAEQITCSGGIKEPIGYFRESGSGLTVMPAEWFAFVTAFYDNSCSKNRIWGPSLQQVPISFGN